MSLTVPIEWQVNSFRRIEQDKRHFWDELVRRGRMSPEERDRQLDVLRAITRTLESHLPERPPGLPPKTTPDAQREARR